MDFKIVKFFNRLGRGTVVDGLTDFVSRILYLAIFWTGVTIAIFFLAKNGKIIATALVIAAGLHFMVTEGLFKHLFLKYFKKVRPYIAYPDEIFPLGRRHADSSFPSSHMSANLSVLTVLVYFYPSIWPAALLFAIFMAFARIHNGMHYLIDILGGVALGIVYGLIAIFLVR